MAETFNYDNLIAGDFPIATKSVTIASGASISRGSVLGIITASGKYKLSASAAGDGSQTPEAILLEDAAAASADVTAPVALTGEFNDNKVILGTGHTVASILAGLRNKSIFLKTPVKS
jgi:hypothetical protein